MAIEGKEILVTLPGTNYAVTYFKRDSSFGLLAKDIVQEDDHRLPHMTAAQFLAKAWKLANEKARELGWIACAYLALDREAKCFEVACRSSNDLPAM